MENKEKPKPSAADVEEWVRRETKKADEYEEMIRQLIRAGKIKGFVDGEGRIFYER